MVTQEEIFNLLTMLRSGEMKTKDFERLKRIVRARVKIKGELREDIAAMAIESIWFSKVVLDVNFINKYVRDRIIDAMAKAGIKTTIKRKTRNIARLDVVFKDEIECPNNEVTDYSKVDKEIDFYNVFWNPAFKTKKLTLSKNGELF